jgi:hypothetical protein
MTRDDDTGTRGTMADVDHTHPHTGEPFSATGTYDRGEEETVDEPEAAD